MRTMAALGMATLLVLAGCSGEGSSGEDGLEANAADPYGALRTVSGKKYGELAFPGCTVAAWDFSQAFTTLPRDSVLLGVRLTRPEAKPVALTFSVPNVDALVRVNCATVAEAAAPLQASPGAPATGHRLDVEKVVGGLLGKEFTARWKGIHGADGVKNNYLAVSGCKFEDFDSLRGTHFRVTGFFTVGGAYSVYLLPLDPTAVKGEVALECGPKVLAARNAYDRPALRFAVPERDMIVAMAKSIGSGTVDVEVLY